jgi:RimJ/RimL family protein N-acetyltransferase
MTPIRERTHVMMTAVTALPLLGLRVQAGPVELRGITDDLLGPLADLAVAGIHAPDAMPFSAPWTAVPAEELPRNFAQYHWRVRASFAPEKWSADLAVFWNGELVGVQGISTEDYLVTRGGETGSWLAGTYQGKGIGTAMRQVMCAFVFDHLDAKYITSSAFTDNPASLAVSRKTGYAENGIRHVSRQGEPATLQEILLTPDRLVRFGRDLTVHGLPEFRRSIGLDN